MNLKKAFMRSATLYTLSQTSSPVVAQALYKSLREDEER